MFKYDFYRFYGYHYNILTKLSKLIKDPGLRYVYLLRMYQESNIYILRKSLKILQFFMQRKYGLDIPFTTKIGKGFYIGHPYNITINHNAIIGNDVNIHKGVTIGQENRGERKGTPRIGNKVYIGVNSTIVGNISVGNNVLIASKSFVNQNIPDNSIVFGNPQIVKKSIDATVGYINYAE